MAAKLNPDVRMESREYFIYLKEFYESADVQNYFDDFEKLLSEQPKQKILDLGCGTGHFSKRLLKLGHDAVSLDLNPHGLAYGQQQGFINQPILGTAEALPLPDQSFDAVFFLDVVEHLKEPAKALEEIHRVLRPPGQLYLTTPNGFYSRLFSRGRNPADPTHRKEYLWFELAHLLKSSGFKITYFKASGLPLINRLSHPLSRRVARRLGMAALPAAAPGFWLIAKKSL